MSITVFEVLKNAQYNLHQNVMLSAIVGREQLDNAIKAIENGKSLEDIYEEE